jgi:hypothetical protein
MSRVRYVSLAALGFILYPTARVAILLALNRLHPEAWNAMFVAETAANLWWAAFANLLAIALSVALVSWLLLRLGQDSAASLAWVVVGAGVLLTGAAMVLGSAKGTDVLEVLDVLCNLIAVLALPLVVLVFRSKPSHPGTQRSREAPGADTRLNDSAR